jgi:hypothetical protein
MRDSSRIHGQTPLALVGNKWKQRLLGSVDVLS